MESLPDLSDSLPFFASTLNKSSEKLKLKAHPYWPIQITDEMSLIFFLNKRAEIAHCVLWCLHCSPEGYLPITRSRHIDFPSISDFRFLTLSCPFFSYIPVCFTFLFQLAKKYKFLTEWKNVFSSQGQKKSQMAFKPYTLGQ